MRSLRDGFADCLQGRGFRDGSVCLQGREFRDGSCTKKFSFFKENFFVLRTVPVDRLFT